MITIEKTISKETIEDIIVTALEGGSNYWYYITSKSAKLIKENSPNMDGEPLALRFVEALSNGCEIDIHDYENPNDEKLGTISLKTMSERTNQLINDGYEENLNNMVEGLGDAIDADIVFQYWVLNELVFG